MAVAVASIDAPARMEVTLVERHVGFRRTVLIGQGFCPACGWGLMWAEVPGQGFCPVPTCAAPIFAVLRPGTRPADALVEIHY